MVALDDVRKNNRGRYKYEVETEGREFERLKATIALLELDNDMLKKLDKRERRIGK